MKLTSFSRETNNFTTLRKINKIVLRKEKEWLLLVMCYFDSFIDNTRKHKSLFMPLYHNI